MAEFIEKLVATVGEKLRLGDAVLRRILNHTAPKSDVLHRHYVGLNEADMAGALVQIQEALAGLMGNARQGFLAAPDPLTVVNSHLSATAKPAFNYAGTSKRA